MQRETHVGTAVVDCIDVLADCEETDRLAADVDDESSGDAEIRERSGADKAFGSERGHRFLLFHQ
jgi:hypothetical protein